MRAYTALADAGILKQRARLCLTWSPDEKFEALLASRNRFARDRVSPDCVKIFLDGVPTDSHTAAMLEPYQGTIPGRTDEAARMGLLLVDQSKLNEAVTRFDRMGSDGEVPRRRRCGGSRGPQRHRGGAQGKRLQRPDA